MSRILLRIEAPHFVAGAVGRYDNGQIEEAAPILAWARRKGWTWGRLFQWARGKGYKVTTKEVRD